MSTARFGFPRFALFAQFNVNSNNGGPVPFRVARNYSRRSTLFSSVFLFKER
jgi:hypothetical protein